jgi:hypothetical protein
VTSTIEATRLTRSLNALRAQNVEMSPHANAYMSDERWAKST